MHVSAVIKKLFSMALTQRRNDQASVLTQILFFSAYNTAIN
jgi:hypothetical protein